MKKYHYNKKTPYKRSPIYGPKPILFLMLVYYILRLKTVTPTSTSHFTFLQLVEVLIL